MYRHKDEPDKRICAFKICITHVCVCVSSEKARARVWYGVYLYLVGELELLCYGVCLYLVGELELWCIMV